MDMDLPSGTPAHITRSPDADRGLVVIPDIGGLRPLFADMCADLARRTGRTVGAFEPFGSSTLPPASDPDGFAQRVDALRSLDDAALLADAVATADATGCERVDLIGFCMGGMYALKAAALDRFERIAAFYGMIKVPEDWVGPGQGQPLDALARRGATEVLALVGTEDAWTPPEHLELLEQAGVDVVRYRGADHGFVHDPERPAHRPDDAEDAWNRTLEFLGR